MGLKCLGGQVKGSLVTYLAHLLDERILASLSIYFPTLPVTPNGDKETKQQRGGEGPLGSILLTALVHHLSKQGMDCHRTMNADGSQSRQRYVQT